MLKWDLLFTLPNLDVPIPTPFSSSGYVICSADDPRLDDLAPNAANTTARRMLDRFSTARGEQYKPACFLIASEVPIAGRGPEAIRAFRNVCAVSTTAAAYASSLEAPQGSGWWTQWSDQFTFSYFIAGKSGWVQTLDGAVKGSDDVIPEQQCAAQFGRPSNWKLRVDEPLLERLLKCWRLCYLQQRKRGALRRLFRSLEVAFHASLYPADGLPSINDVGTRLALWVSAFEVLCHTGRSVDKRDVQKVISAAPYTLMAVTAKRYSISYRGKQLRVTLPEAIYDDLYWARNQFLHGMPVRLSTLRYRQSMRFARLLQTAPILFNVAIGAYLDRARLTPNAGRVMPGTVNGLVRYMRARRGLDRAQAALVAAARPLTDA